MSPDPGRVTVVGPGRVGQSVALALADAGLRVDLRGRGPAGPDRTAGRPGVTYRSGVSDPAPTLVFAVPDDELEGAAREWSGAEPSVGTDPPRPPRPSPGAAPVALHTSGVHRAAVLAPLRSSGYALASWHPLTAVATPGPDAFRGVPFGVAGDPGGRARAELLAERVGGRVLPVAEGEHARYHAAAVFASNHLLACLRIGADELAAATEGEGDEADLLPLARAALRNVEERGLTGGLTGPVARGDAGTVARHLEALSPGRRAVYRGLARELLRIVEDRPADSGTDALRRVLSRPDGAG